MNIRAFGYYVLLAGIALLSASYHYYHSVNNDLFKASISHEREGMIYGSSSAQDRHSSLKITQNAAEQKSLIFGSIGGVIAFLGFGLIMTANPVSNSDDKKIMQQQSEATNE